MHPVHVEDMARLCVESGLDDHGLKEYDLDACNPETTNYLEMLEMMRDEMVFRSTEFLLFNEVKLFFYG